MAPPKENSLSDEELHAFLNEIGLYAQAQEKKRVLPEPQRLRLPEKKAPPPQNSLKISLIITLSLFLFTLVQAAFLIPLYTTLLRIEEKIEKLELSAPSVFPSELLAPFPDDEVIEPIEPSLYNNA